MKNADLKFAEEMKRLDVSDTKFGLWTFAAIFSLVISLAMTFAYLVVTSILAWTMTCPATVVTVIDQASVPMLALFAMSFLSIGCVLVIYGNFTAYHALRIAEEYDES